MPAVVLKPVDDINVYLKEKYPSNAEYYRIPDSDVPFTCDEIIKIIARKATISVDDLKTVIEEKRLFSYHIDIAIRILSIIRNSDHTASINDESLSKIILTDLERSEMKELKKYITSMHLNQNHGKKKYTILPKNIFAALRYKYDFTKISFDDEDMSDLELINKLADIIAPLKDVYDFAHDFLYYYLGLNGKGRYLPDDIRFILNPKTGYVEYYKIFRELVKVLADQISLSEIPDKIKERLVLILNYYYKNDIPAPLIIILRRYTISLDDLFLSEADKLLLKKRALSDYISMCNDNEKNASFVLEILDENEKEELANLISKIRKQLKAKPRPNRTKNQPKALNNQNRLNFLLSGIVLKPDGKQNDELIRKALIALLLPLKRSQVSDYRILFNVFGLDGNGRRAYCEIKHYTKSQKKELEIKSRVRQLLNDLLDKVETYPNLNAILKQELKKVITYYRDFEIMSLNITPKTFSRYVCPFLSDGDLESIKKCRRKDYIELCDPSIKDTFVLEMPTAEEIEAFESLRKRIHFYSKIKSTNFFEIFGCKNEDEFKQVIVPFLSLQEIATIRDYYKDYFIRLILPLQHMDSTKRLVLDTIPALEANDFRKSIISFDNTTNKRCIVFNYISYDSFKENGELRALFIQLPEHFKKVCIMYYVQQMNSSDIAKSIGNITTQAVITILTNFTISARTWIEKNSGNKHAKYLSQIIGLTFDEQESLKDILRLSPDKLANIFGQLTIKDLIVFKYHFKDGFAEIFKEKLTPLIRREIEKESISYVFCPTDELYLTKRVSLILKNAFHKKITTANVDVSRVVNQCNSIDSILEEIIRQLEIDHFRLLALYYGLFGEERAIADSLVEPFGFVSYRAMMIRVHYLQAFLTSLVKTLECNDEYKKKIIERINAYPLRGKTTIGRMLGCSDEEYIILCKANVFNADEIKKIERTLERANASINPVSVRMPAFLKDIVSLYKSVVPQLNRDLSATDIGNLLLNSISEICVQKGTIRDETYQYSVITRVLRALDIPNETKEELFARFSTKRKVESIDALVEENAICSEEIKKSYLRLRLKDVAILFHYYPEQTQNAIPLTIRNFILRLLPKNYMPDFDEVKKLLDAITYINKNERYYYINQLLKSVTLPSTNLDTQEILELIAKELTIYDIILLSSRYGLFGCTFSDMRNLTKDLNCRRQQKHDKTFILKTQIVDFINKSNIGEEKKRELIDYIENDKKSPCSVQTSLDDMRYVEIYNMLLSLGIIRHDINTYKKNTLNEKEKLQLNKYMCMCAFYGAVSRRLGELAENELVDTFKIASIMKEEIVNCFHYRNRQFIYSFYMGFSGYNRDINAIAKELSMSAATVYQYTIESLGIICRVLPAFNLNPRVQRELYEYFTLFYYIEGQEELREFIKNVDGLSDELKNVLVMRYCDGTDDRPLPISDIAQSIGVDEEKAWQMLIHARNVFKLKANTSILKGKNL